MRDPSFENHAYHASGLNLLAASMILWNTYGRSAVAPEIVSSMILLHPVLASVSRRSEASWAEVETRRCLTDAIRSPGMSAN